MFSYQEVPGVCPVYLDANKSLLRLVGPNGDVCPWSITFPTMTCNGVYIMRRAPTDGPPPELVPNVELRHLDGMELLQILKYLKGIHGDFPGHEDLTRMAGNAFSGFAAGAVVLGVCAQLSLQRSAIEHDDDDGESERG